MSTPFSLYAQNNDILSSDNAVLDQRIGPSTRLFVLMNMAERLITLILLLNFTAAFGQKVVDYQQTANGSMTLAPGVTVPKINSGYTLWLPESGSIDGLVVFMHSRRDTVNAEFVIEYALDSGLGVMYATTDNSLEFFFDLEAMQEVENYIREVVATYKVPEGNLLFCGMSLAGTRALRLAIFSQGPESKYRLRPRAIAVCDAPLDMVRFHKEMVKAKQLNFNAITANEGNWVSAYLENRLGKYPDDDPSAYINYSPYCYAANGGPNLKYFKNVPIRAYTEPDVNWWIETRRKDYYSMNAIDMAALINELRILNNQDAELISTTGKGYRPDGTRHPHSWSIVDEKDLIDWFVGLLE